MTSAGGVPHDGPRCKDCDGSGYASTRDGQSLGTCRTCDGHGDARCEVVELKANRKHAACGDPLAPDAGVCVYHLTRAATR